MKTNQIIVLVSLLLTLISWTRGRTRKSISSIFLLFVFAIFGNTPLEKVFSFPLSPSFSVIALSFVFSQGIVNTGLTEKLFEPLIGKYSSNIHQFLLFMIFVILILSFIIPQPFSRAILIALVYKKYFEELGLGEKSKEALLFSLFAFSAVINTMFKEADIILNRAMIMISGLEITNLQWIKFLTLPGLGLLILIYLALIFIFKREFSDLDLGKELKEKPGLSRGDGFNLLIILATTLLWMTEGLHGIGGVYFLLAGIILMYSRKVLEVSDLKSLNPELLIFLTAAFSIGNVMMGSGIAQGLMDSFSLALPGELSYGFLFTMMVIAMLVHMVLGSVTTSLSVAIPSFYVLTKGVVSPLVISLILFSSMANHYILPIHHALISVGLGNSFYGNKPVIKLGLITGLITFVALFLFYFPWWQFLGLI